MLSLPMKRGLRRLGMLWCRKSGSKEGPAENMIIGLGRIVIIRYFFVVNMGYCVSHLRLSSILMLW